jgi:hypothetical protein
LLRHRNDRTGDIVGYRFPLSFRFVHRIQQGSMLRKLIIPSMVGLVLACGHSSGGISGVAPLRQDSDLPERFEPPAAFPRIPPADTIAGGGCLNPMWDTRYNVELTMMRAANGSGDYAVPNGRYGVGERELLRLDCNTGRPIGVVRR